MTVNAMTAQKRMWSAIRSWMVELDKHPGWREWRRSKISYTLFFDDEIMPSKEIDREFRFSEKVEAEHAVVIQYLKLLDTVNSLRDVEWYFRRYPFAGTPVTRHNHLSHCCELFFGRFYQFKERLKNLFDALDRAVPGHGLGVGKFIKSFDKIFENEIRARHGVHHRERFEDVAIMRISLAELIATSKLGQGQEREYLLYYRRAANEWAARTRRQAEELDSFVEAVTTALLEVCPFLQGADRYSEAASEGV